MVPDSAPTSAPGPISTPSPSAPGLTGLNTTASAVAEVPRTEGSSAGQSEPPAAPRPRLPVVWVQHDPSPGASLGGHVRRTSPTQRGSAPEGGDAPQLERAAGSETESAQGRPSTTMVRVSSRGTLLAARGAQSEQLANAAAFIHNQARLIAQDLGRHGRTAVHVRGGELSLLVVKSEVNDIAAALGPSERLRSLLRKAGLG